MNHSIPERRAESGPRVEWSVGIGVESETEAGGRGTQGGDRETMQPIAIRLHADGRRFVAETEADLNAALAAADQRADIEGQLGLIDFQAANGNTLYFVVGGPETALSFKYADERPAQFVSRGSVSATGPDLECYLHFTHEFAYPRWTVIPRAAGLEALKEFARSNDRPATVEWAEI
jgi:hypothetical protein